MKSSGINSNAIAYKHAVISIVTSLTLLSFAGQISADNGNAWRLSSGGIHNQSFADKEFKINKDSVKDLTVKWIYETSPNIYGLPAAVFSTPSVSGNKVFFTDTLGNITAIDKTDARVIWKKNIFHEIAPLTGYDILYSRNTPAVSKDKLVFGSSIQFATPICAVVEKQGFKKIPRSGGILNTNNTQNVEFNCTEGHGAVVMALNKNTGDYLWSTRVSDHPAAKISGSVTIVGNTVFVPVGGWEEDFARRLPNIFDTVNADYPNEIKLLGADDIDLSQPYPCCSATGKVVALDLRDGSIKWSTNLAIGTDQMNKLPGNANDPNTLKGALGEKGFFGVSTYGENIPVDLARKSVYVATTNSYTAPPILQECERARRETGKANPDQSDLNLPLPKDEQGNTYSCNDLTESFKSYPNSVVALDTKSGDVRWSFHASLYDAWNHGCDAPDLTVGPYIVPVLWPDPITNANNCPNVIGPDFGFGSQPIIIKKALSVNGQLKDILAAGNKDGIIYFIDPDDGSLVRKTRVGPGGLYGGIQFGMATDRKRIYTGTNNTHNQGRDINLSFVSKQEYVDANINNNPFYTGGVEFRVSKEHLFPGDPGTERPANPIANANALFPGPLFALSGDFIGQLLAGSTRGAGYPELFPKYDDDNQNTGDFFPVLSGPTSGPKAVWKLINPPSDVKSDCVNVFNVYIDTSNPLPDLANCEIGKTAGNGYDLYTIAGIVSAVDIKTGAVVWQRPAVDGIGATVDRSGVYGAPTVTNELVFIGYADGKGTVVALDSDTGEKKFQYNVQFPIGDNSFNDGSVVGNPAIVKGKVYLGVGHDTFGPFQPDQNGNRVIAFELPNDKGDGTNDSAEVDDPGEDMDDTSN